LIPRLSGGVYSPQFPRYSSARFLSFGVFFIMVVDRHILVRSLLSGFVLMAVSIATMALFIPSTSEDRFEVRTMIVFFFVGFFLTMWQLGSHEAQRRKHRAAAHQPEKQPYNPQSSHNKSSHK
jgi:lysylphosphatidylglycerol synthetase-like protein (DUF2156 family)